MNFKSMAISTQTCASCYAIFPAENKPYCPACGREVIAISASRRPRVYTASKLGQIDLWMRLRTEWPEVEFTSTWHSHVINGTPDLPEQAEAFWLEDEEDVISSDAVLVYAEPGEHLRGALVEAGMGIAMGIHVIVVGEHPDYGTWQYHPMVQRVADLDAARQALARLL